MISEHQSTSQRNNKTVDFNLQRIFSSQRPKVVNKLILHINTQPSLLKMYLLPLILHGCGVLFKKC